MYGERWAGGLEEDGSVDARVWVGACVVAAAAAAYQGVGRLAAAYAFSFVAHPPLVVQRRRYLRSLKRRKLEHQKEHESEYEYALPPSPSFPILHHFFFYFSAIAPFRETEDIHIQTPTIVSLFSWGPGRSMNDITSRK